jgi:hypothetical protein
MDEFSIQSLAIIEGSSILTGDEFTKLAALKTELQETFRNVQVFRTRTEMEASILNDLKFPTPDSKYWQSVREQNVMFTELVSLSYEYRKNQVEIKKLIRDMPEDELDAELQKIEIERRLFIATNQERTAKDRIREIQDWHEIKERLIPDMLCGQTDADKHQLLSYTIRWLQQLSGLNANTAIAERNNLVGQADKGLKLCRQHGLMKQLNEALGNDYVQLAQQAIGGI